VPGFLLDNNHVYEYYRHANSVVGAHIASIPQGAVIFGSAICLGEIAAGHRMQTRDKQTPAGQAKRDEFELWLNEKFVPNAKEVTTTTTQYYAELMGRIWESHPPSGKKTQTELHLLRSDADHKAGLAHYVMNGVDINDVWAVALAWEHGLTFVTTDSMDWVREAAKKDVAWDCWIPKSSPYSSSALSPPTSQSPPRALPEHS
jgi:predicted nucleic acid-binding protein